MNDSTKPEPLRASELDEDSGFNFEIDLRGLPSDEELSEQREAGASGENAEPTPVELARHLSRLLEPYRLESVDKAEMLLRQGKVDLVKEEGQSKWFNIRGSKLYVTKITHGADFLFAECSCPNGTHRGGDAICYHSIAARVMDAGLVATWLN